VNSILWIRRGKDTLAFGNIAGAMVFQGTLLPAIGIMLPPWQPRIHLRTHGIPVWVLLGNGVLYVAYLIIMLTR
jgi:cation:H+ antiporter